MAVYSVQAASPREHIGACMFRASFRRSGMGHTLSSPTRIPKEFQKPPETCDCETQAMLLASE